MVHLFRIGLCTVLASFGGRPASTKDYLPILFVTRRKIVVDRPQRIAPLEARGARGSCRHSKPSRAGCRLTQFSPSSSATRKVGKLMAHSPDSG
eukprot:scaffold426153_cov12-Prasinocladus_malaysianus.AAC.1